MVRTMFLKNLTWTHENVVTDVAAEMDALKDTLRHCKTCFKACTAAVEMLAVGPFFKFLNV